MNTDRAQRVLLAVTQRSDVMLAVLVVAVAVIFMMILPLPTILVDMLIATNMTIGIVTVQSPPLSKGG